MPDILLIEIQNKLVNQKKSIDVYHHVTGITDTISYNHSITLPIKTFISKQKPDFIQITIKKEPGDSIEEIAVNLPSWAKYEFSPNNNIDITIIYLENRTLLKIPPCPPTWKLKIYRPDNSTFQSNDNVIIHDDFR
jgi:hypothetical protein